MPQSIQSDLSIKCMDIMYSREQAIQNSDFKFIDKIQIKNADVSKQLYELLQSIFKTISSQFRDLVQKDSAEAAKNEKMEKDNKELLLQIGELKANEEKLRTKYEKELSMIKESVSEKDKNLLNQQAEIIELEQQLKEVKEWQAQKLTATANMLHTVQESVPELQFERNQPQNAISESVAEHDIYRGLIDLIQSQKYSITLLEREKEEVDQQKELYDSKMDQMMKSTQELGKMKEDKDSLLLRKEEEI